MLQGAHFHDLAVWCCQSTDDAVAVVFVKRRAGRLLRGHGSRCTLAGQEIDVAGLVVDHSRGQSYSRMEYAALLAVVERLGLVLPLRSHETLPWSRAGWEASQPAANRRGGRDG